MSATGYRPVSPLTKVQDEAVDSIIDLPDGAVPKGDHGTLALSGAASDPKDEWIFDQAVEVPQASLKISDSLRISEATTALFIRDNIIRANFVAPLSTIDESGTTGPFLAEAATRITVEAQPDDSTLITTNPIALPTQATYDNQTDTFALRAASPMTNVRMTLLDVESNTILKYLPDKVSVMAGEGGMDFIAGENIVNMNSDEPNTPGFINVGFTPLRGIAGRISIITIEADNVALLGNASGIPYIRNEIQRLFLSRVAMIRDASNISDSYIHLNDNHVSTQATDAGVVATVKETGLTDTVTFEQFSEGLQGVFNPTVSTDGVGTFAPSDIIQIIGTRLNDGLYEVSSHLGTTLTIRGVGTDPTTEGFVKDDFLTDIHDGYIAKVQVAVIKMDTLGQLAVACGSNTQLAFAYPLVPATGAVSRSFGAGGDMKTLSASLVQYDGFDTNGPEDGLFTSDQTNNQITITEVVDTTNGDIYELDAYGVVLLGLTTK